MHIIFGRKIKGFGCVKAYKFLVYLFGSSLGRGIYLRMVKLDFRALGFNWVIFVDYYFFFFQIFEAFGGLGGVERWVYDILIQIGNEVLTMKV